MVKRYIITNRHRSSSIVYNHVDIGIFWHVKEQVWNPIEDQIIQIVEFLIEDQIRDELMW